MADPRFFRREGPFSLKQLAALGGCGIASGGNAALEIVDVAPLETAGAADLSFFDNVRYRDAFRKSGAGACVARPDEAEHAPDGMVLLVTPNPYKSYALIAQAFYPEQLPAPGISEDAHVAPSATIGAGCIIEAGAVIGEGAEIDECCYIGPNAVIGNGVKMGRSSRVGANANVAYAIIGDNVNIYPGARIGQDGFGFAIDPAGFVKVPQLGRVIIGDSVEIGANTCVDRGAGPDTVIGAGTWIDNLVQVAHNVKIGKCCAIAAQVGISGSTVLEDFIMVGGQTGFAGHITVGKGARISGHSGVISDVPPGEQQMGFPSQPSKQYLRQIAVLKNLATKKKTD